MIFKLKSSFDFIILGHGYDPIKTPLSLSIGVGCRGYFALNYFFPTWYKKALNKKQAEMRISYDY